MPEDEHVVGPEDDQGDTQVSVEPPEPAEEPEEERSEKWGRGDRPEQIESD